MAQRIEKEIFLSDDDIELDADGERSVVQKVPRPRDSEIEIAEQVASVMARHPPHISEKGAPPGVVDAQKRKSQLRVALAMKGAALEFLLLSTASESLDHLLQKFRRLAAEENLEIIVEKFDDDSEIVITLRHRQDFRYEKPLRRETLIFIGNFEYEITR